MIALTILSIILFWSFGWFMILIGGMVPKMTAPWLFIATMPMIVAKQVVWADTATGPAIFTISLPVNIIGPFFSVALLFSLIGIWSAFEYMGRDYVGRRRNKPKR